MHHIIHTLTNTQRFLLLLGAVGAIFLLVRAIAQGRRNPHGLPLPPGPRGLPLIGNLFQVPQYNNSPWKGFDALCREYGDMVYLNVLGQGMLVLGSPRRASDLLDKRAAIYSDRPQVAVNDLMHMNWMMGGMAYGTVWRNNRRTFHQHLNHNATVNYHPIMNEERNRLLEEMGRRPEDFLSHARVFFGRSAMRTAYGFDETEQTEWHIHNADQLLEAVEYANTPGKFMVNVFPILKYIPSWFPGAGFQKYFQEQTIKNQRTLEGPFEEARINMVRDKRSSHSSVAAALIERLPDVNDPAYPESKAIAMNTCAAVYIAGADTSVTSATALILALASNPQVQKKAQAELDEVVGKIRLPLISDRPALPYVHAIVKEATRWHSVLPMGLPHATSKDDEYDGYYIPQGTYVLPNVWAMMHNSGAFERPLDFVPERYLKDGRIDDVEVATFGFGRRICPGRHLSNDALFLFAASLLAVYDIEPPLDEVGRFIPLELEMISGLVAKLAPFRCIFRLRQGAADILNQ